MFPTSVKTVLCIREFFQPFAKRVFKRVTHSDQSSNHTSLQRHHFLVEFPRVCLCAFQSPASLKRSSGVIYFMAKDKSLKSKPPKRKNLGPADDSREIMDSEVNAKRKRTDVDEAPAQMSHPTNTTIGEKQKKNKKHRKQQVNQGTEQSKETEILDPPSCPEGTAELEGLEDLSPEEKRVLERKLKKVRKKEEKKRLKEEGMTLQKTNPPGPSAEQQALDYLTCWAENRSQWKFQKTRQTWLLQHIFDSEKIPEEKYSVLLQYLEGLRGSGRDTTVQKALSLVEESGKAPEDIVVQQRAHRAREVIQLLS